MNTVERSPSPLMFTKQHSDSEQPSPSSSLALPSVTSSLPSNSPQMKRKFVSEGRKSCRHYLYNYFTVACKKFQFDLSTFSA